MDELVKNTTVTGGALVKALTVLMPGESIEKILDSAREVNLKRILNTVKARGYETVIHLVDELEADGLSDEDIKTILTLIGQEDPEAKTLVESGLLNSVLKFVSVPEPSMPHGCCTRLKLILLKWLTRNRAGTDP
jgi:Glu-tRNA(Gln) amidotransferase subunit E-like FAD-binding protein